MKNFELQSPSIVHLTLVFCLQYTSSFSNTSSNCPFLKVFFVASSGLKIPCSFSSKPTMSKRIFFFFSFKSPKDTLFNSFNFDLTNWNFFMSFWPSHPSNQYSFHQQPKLSLKSEWNNHMFSNLKGVAPHLKRLVFDTIGQLSKVNLGSASWMLWGNPCSHSLENKNLSNLLQTGVSCEFDHVKDAFLRGGSINSQVLAPN